jgi:hypothetical protein
MDEKDRSATPEQQDSFEKGHEEKPDPPEENLDPDFARGQAAEEPGKQNRYSEGIETSGDTPEKEVQRRFSEGIERNPNSE